MRVSLCRLTQLFCSSSQSPVNLSFRDHTHSAHLTLSNPKKRNPMSLETIQLLKKNLLEVQSKIQEKKLKIAILEGQGTVFSAGHDLKELGKSENPKQIFDEFTDLMLYIRRFPIPTLCAINGVAAAAGFQLAMGCDIIIATEKSSFSCPGVKWGVFCSTPGVELVRTITSIKKANEMLLFGESISAQEAFQYGIVNKVIPQGQYKQSIDAYISKANTLSGEVVAYGKMILNQQQKQNIEQAYEIAGSAMNHNIKTFEDCQEGLKAFAQKRHPHFKN